MFRVKRPFSAKCNLHLGAVPGKIGLNQIAMYTSNLSDGFTLLGYYIQITIPIDSFNQLIYLWVIALSAHIAQYTRPNLAAFCM